MPTILLIHGPNLNKLGQREAEHYGLVTLPELEQMVGGEAQKLGFKVKTIQSNHEGVLIDWIQNESAGANGIIINPGALTHYSYALHDALVDANLPTIEVHLSDIMHREAWRRNSVIAPACVAQIYGQGQNGYTEAIKILTVRLGSR